MLPTEILDDITSLQRISARLTKPIERYSTWTLPQHTANSITTTPKHHYTPNDFTLILNDEQQDALKALQHSDTSSPSTSLEVSTEDIHPITQQENHQYASSALNVDTGLPAEYSKLIKTSEGPEWEHAGTLEYARLCQGCPPAGVPVSEGMNTMQFIARHEVPDDRDATYARLVVADRPHKVENKRVRVTVGGDKIDYPDDVSTKTSSIPTAKTVLNSVISTPAARAFTCDVKNFYLNTPMARAEYMKIHIRNIPKAIMDYYKLWGLVYKDHVYVRITKGMYGLPQAGRLANDQLIKFLTAAGYSQSRLVPGLFTHDTRPIQFCLVVDDFLVKYTGEEHAQHFIATLKQHYTITVDMEAKQYLGLQLDWNYKERYVDVSMPGYEDKALARFQHPAPRKQQHSPFPWAQPTYGAKTQ